MKKDLAKVYDPKNVEDRIYREWLEKKYFHAGTRPRAKTYTIVIPPPNITGQLHMGHALDETLQDILVRWKRMQGYDTLWLPGTDHASIATEKKIVDALRDEGTSKEEIGREAFLERAWQWRAKYGGRIVEQLKKIGCSCDWDRERFTLDEGCSRAVREVFVNLYEKGLIYRGKRIVNWCPHCETTLSDAEVEYEEQDGSFWHIKYPYSDGSGYIEIATTRPETMLGDTAVAVHPEDERYKDAVGKTLILPIVGKEIPIIADTYVERDFGTGAVKITPAHDPNDFEVGQRHSLPVIDVMTDDGHMSANAGRFAGMDRYECRKAIVRELEEKGLLVSVEPMKHNVGTCYRCHTSIEPRISTQWFVRMAPLAGPAIDVVRDGEIKFIPDRFSKTYYNWMENIRDWCISRQLWWGHRIPAWYCADCGETIVSKDDPDCCPKCGSKNITRDPDTLDTWFSSALWPFSTMGWPDDAEDLKRFFPTDTLVTGYDIIFFWVARMIFSSVEHTGKIPFNTVLIHGLVRDAQGRKMSKSLGNGIDPLEIIDKFGADALRFTLATGNSPGNDMRFSDEKVEASRNFANKIWNAARFVLMNLDENEPAPHIPDEADLATPDKWILHRYNALVSEVTDALERFELGMAVSRLYDFIWDVYCDWYIELCKTRLNAGGKAKETAKAVLVYVMSGMMKLLHPFMPFITEEIWQTLPHSGDSIMIADWPAAAEDDYAAETAEMEKIIEAIRAIRNRRAEMNVKPSRKTNVYVVSSSADTFAAGAEFFKKLASAEEVFAGEKLDVPEGCVSIVTPAASVYIPLSELVDFEAERARLNKELASDRKQYDGLTARLANENFTSRAPAQVVENERKKAKELEAKIAQLETEISKLG